MGVRKKKITIGSARWRDLSAVQQRERESKRKLEFIDGEKRPPFGITTKQIVENAVVADLRNRIAELEQTNAGYARGDELAFLSSQARTIVEALSRTGLYGDSPRQVVREIVNAALRTKEIRDIVYAQQYDELHRTAPEIIVKTRKRR